MKKYLGDLLFGIGLVVLIVTTRTIWHVGENLEFVTAASLMAGYFMSHKRLAFIVPFFGMMTSDLIIGNDKSFLFTWSAFLIAPVLGFLVHKYAKNFLTRLTSMQASGVMFTVFFFLWTNFGVVVISEMYSKDLSGLARSYVNALPFLQNQLLGNIVLVPTMFMVIYLVRYASKSIGLGKFLNTNN